MAQEIQRSQANEDKTGKLFASLAVAGIAAFGAAMPGLSRGVIQFQAKEYARWRQVIETGGITAS
ncbi:MAG: hypothetical protein EON54_14985 [Alcaligenaceae bacterium]|nr:MAG: hypothetical protein EON54_14985 [Alcaligenaceae bacterium]